MAAGHMLDLKDGAALANRITIASGSAVQIALRVKNYGTLRIASVAGTGENMQDRFVPTGWSVHQAEDSATADLHIPTMRALASVCGGAVEITSCVGYQAGAWHRS